jgi:hypothetical protein
MPQCHRGKFPEQYYNLWWDLEGRVILEVLFGPDLLWESEHLYLATGGLGDHERVRSPR